MRNVYLLLLLIVSSLAMITERNDGFLKVAESREGFLIKSTYLANSKTFPAGDMNGDGYPDIALYGGSNWGSGSFNIILGGKTESLEDFDLYNTTEDRVLTFNMRGYLYRFSSGDFNGDGLSDLIVEAQGYAIYVVYGSRSLKNGLDLATMDVTQGFNITCNNRYRARPDIVSAASAGDVNGDGIDDIIVGIERPSMDQSLTAVVLWGGKSLKSINLVYNYTSDMGFKIVSGSGFLYVLRNLGTVGDINNDGYSDIYLVGGLLMKQSNATIIYGGPSMKNVNITNMTIEQGFNITSTVHEGGLYGDSLLISKAGDINKDGYADILIGDPKKRNETVLVVYGRKALFDTIDLNNFDEALGFKITGYSSLNYEEFGYGIGPAGDFNGDGYADIHIHAKKKYDGTSYIVYGGKNLKSFAIQNMTEGQGFEVETHIKAVKLDNMIAVVGVRDVNKDGFDDLIVKAHKGPDGGLHGHTYYVWFGNNRK